MWKRKLNVVPYWIGNPISKINALFADRNQHNMSLSFFDRDRDTLNLLDETSPELNFSQSEIEFGEEKLRSWGVPKDAKIVCINIRDDAFKKSVFGQDNITKYEHHDYRNVDIENHVLVAKYLASKGFYVFRMGSKVKKKLPINNNEKIIDYATCGYRSDFMDIFLAYKAYFIVSTGTGWDNVGPWIFRKHAVFENLCPIAVMPTYSNKWVLLTKRYFCTKTNKELTLKEIFERKVGFFLFDKEYKENNIELIQNTSEEIKSAVDEMLLRLESKWIESEEDKKLQREFWKIYSEKIGELSFNNKDGDQPNLLLKRKLHGQFKSFYSSNFLRSNPNWLK